MTPPGHGTQAARTALGWQRTGLSVAVAAAVLARLTYDALGVWALIALAASLGLCGWVLVESRARYRGRVGESAERPAVGGWAAAVSASILVMGLTELVVLLGQ